MIEQDIGGVGDSVEGSDNADEELVALRRDLLSFFTQEMAKGGIDGTQPQLSAAIVAALRDAARQAMTEALDDHNREISTLSASISRSLDRPASVNVDQLADQLAARLSRAPERAPERTPVEDTETLIAEDEPNQARLLDRVRGLRNATIFLAILVGALAIALAALFFLMQQRLDQASQKAADMQTRLDMSHADNRRAERTILQLCDKLKAAPAAGRASAQTADAALCAR